MFRDENKNHNPEISEILSEIFHVDVNYVGYVGIPDVPDPMRSLLQSARACQGRSGPWNVHHGMQTSPLHQVHPRQNDWRRGDQQVSGVPQGQGSNIGPGRKCQIAKKSGLAPLR